MLLQMQVFFKDMNAICKVLNIGQPVLQIMTVLSFVSRVLKNDMKVLLLVQKLLWKTVILLFLNTQLPPVIKVVLVDNANMRYLSNLKRNLWHGLGNNGQLVFWGGGGVGCGLNSMLIKWHIFALSETLCSISSCFRMFEHWFDRKCMSGSSEFKTRLKTAYNSQSISANWLKCHLQHVTLIS